VRMTWVILFAAGLFETGLIVTGIVGLKLAR
jgi:hypothetical protein